MNVNVPILMYHHVVPFEEVSPLSPYAVSQEQFARHLDVIQRLGYQTLTLSALVDRWDRLGQETCADRVVAITFDDCPSALMDYAVPELVRRGLTATFFPVAGNIGARNDWDTGAPTLYPLMSGAELCSLARRGFEIGSHGMSHRHLRQCSPETVGIEMLESRRCLQELVGQPVNFFAYPFGEFPADYAKSCQTAGYRGAVSIFSQARSVGSDRFCMRRVLVHEGDRELRLRFKLSGAYQRLRPFVDRRVLAADPTRVSD